MSRLPILVILGDRTAQEVYEAAQLGLSSKFASIEKLYFEPDKFAREDVPRLRLQADEVYFHAGMVNDLLKQEVVRCCEASQWKPLSIIHPTAVISPTATVNAGVFVGPLVVISSHAFIDQHCIVHIHASVGHDARIGEFSAVLPGARISGNVVVGKRSLVGSNAFVAAGKAVGDDCRIDALSYVQQDLLSGHIVSPRYSRPVPRVDIRGTGP